MRLRLTTLLLSLSILSGCIGFKAFDFPLGERVALVEVKGIIIEPDEVVESLEKARKSRDIKAIVVRVDSPGGSVAASQEIFRAIKNINKKKPVIISMGDFATSGGYYVSAGAGKIFANEGTTTGSIGVRLEYVNAEGLFRLIRLEPETLKSGKFKDIGSATRPMTPEDRAILENFLVELHDQFKNDIAVSRGLDIEKVNKLADGRIYTGAKAKELGLVDEIGGLTEAVAEAKRAAGIKGEPRIIKMKKERAWWMDIITDKAGALIGQISGKISGYKYFLYEWKP